MREIIFRGKRVDGKGWVYGDLINSMGKPHIGIESDERNPLGDRYYSTVEVIPETVGQYTGVNDMNRVKIFEGDEGEISSLHYHEKADGFEGVVTYLADGFYVDSGADAHNLWSDSYEFVVKGNIHDKNESNEKV